MGLSAGIDQVIQASPELITSPGMALDAAGSQDPSNYAQALSHAQSLNAAGQTVVGMQADTQNSDTNTSASGGGGFFSALAGAAHVFGSVFQNIPGIHGVEHAVGVTASALGVPLQEVQRDYKYLHMQWKKNPVIGFGQTLGVIGGFVGGNILAPGVGGFAGADAALMATRGLASAGLFGGEARSLATLANDPSVKISIGRDIANAIGQTTGISALTHTDSGIGKYVSGISDAAFDFTGDPIVVAAKLKTGLKFGEWATLSERTAEARRGDASAQAIMENGKPRDNNIVRMLRNLGNGDVFRLHQSQTAQQFFDAHAPGLRISNPDTIDTLWNAPIAGSGVRRAFTDIARVNATADNPAGVLAQRYPNLSGLLGNTYAGDGKTVLVPGLDKMKTAEDVRDYFKNIASNDNFAARLDNAAVLPSRTRTHAVGSQIAEWARNADPEAGLRNPSPADGVLGAPNQQSLRGAAFGATKSLATGNPGDALQAVRGAVARKVNTFSGYMPSAIDSKTLAQSTRSFEVVNGVLPPRAANSIPNAFWSLGTSRKRYWTDQFVNAPDEATRKQIWANAHVETLISAGLPDNNNLVLAARQAALDSANPSIDSVKGGVYGFGYENGANVGLQPVGDDAQTRALWNHQASEVYHFPDYNEVVGAMRQLQGALKANYGKFDDMASAKFIKPIFKPMAVGNFGFAQRVSLAEQIPQVIREGVMNTLRAHVATRAATIGYKLAPGEADDVIAAASHSLREEPWQFTKDILGKAVKGQRQVRGGAWNGLNVLMNDPLRRDFALRMVMDGEGHIATGIASAAHAHGGAPGLDNDPAEAHNSAGYAFASQNKNHPAIKWQSGSDFGTFSPADDKYDGYMHGNLSKMSQEKPVQSIARDLLAEPAARTIPLPLHPENPAEPAASNLPPLFHGTSRGFEGDQLAPSGYRDSGPDNLMGYGFYTTDAENVARTYTRKGAGGNPRVYSVKWKGDKPPNLLDLDKPADPKVRTWARGIVGSSTLDATQETHDALARLIADPHASGADIISASRHYLSESEIPKSEAQEVMGDLADTLHGGGYDGLKHVGGSYAGDGSHPHNVHIFFDNDKLGVGIRPQAQTIPGDRVDAAVSNEERQVQKALDGAPDADPAYVTEMHNLMAYANIQAGNMSARDFAYQRVDAVRGALHGQDGTFHTALAQKLANGEKPALADIEQIPLESRPAQVYGPQMVPYIGPKLAQRIVNNGFEKIVGGPVNHLSRDPMFFQSTYKEYQNLKPLVDAGTLDEASAMQIAKTRGAVSMLPKIHNVALRSQFAELARNYMPFYFAQEQALKRAAFLIAEHPEALRQYQLIEHGLSDPGFVKQDSQGNKYLVLPGGGAFTNAIMHLQGMGGMGDSMQYGLPVSATGSMTSLSTVLPEVQMPGVSPLVSIPLNHLTGMFPELSPAVKSIIGARGFGQSAVDALLPSPITKNLYRFVDPSEADRSYANGVITAIEGAYAAGRAPGPDASAAERDAFIARIKNDTRSTFMAKLFLGMVSPLAPSVSLQQTGWRDEFQALVKKQGIKDGLATFLKEHGSNAISYTVAHSKPSVDGATLPYTDQGINWLIQNQALAKSDFATGAAFLVPQAKGNGDIQTIHSELLRMHLRSTDTPAEFLQAVNIAQGNAVIYPQLAKYLDFKAANVNNKQALATGAAAWSNFVKLQGDYNPQWYQDYSSTKKTQNAVKAFNDLKMMITYGGERVNTPGGVKDVPAIPPGEQTALVLGLMQDYQAHAAQQSRDYGTARATAGKTAWQQYLQQKADSDERLVPIINAVFKRLDAGETYAPQSGPQPVQGPA